MSLMFFLAMGCLGALMMFAGDMLLYYNKRDFVSDGTLDPVIENMKETSRARLYVGSMLGSVSAFVYCVGYCHTVAMNIQHPAFGWACFLINCVGIICGGAYHTHWVYLGQIGKVGDKAALDEVKRFMDAFQKLSYGIIAVGFALLLAMVALGWTVLPRWMALLSPGVLFLVTPVLKLLPKGWHMVIGGGWSNLISVIYYVAAMLVVALG